MNYADFAVLGLTSVCIIMVVCYEWGLHQLRKQIRELGERPRY